MPPVVHFEILSDDPPRAIRFYTEVFGWSFAADANHNDYWRIDTGGDAGIRGGLTRPYHPALQTGAGGWICTIQVDTLDGYAESIEAAGGTVAVPRFPIAGVGAMLHARDPDGNVVGLIEKTAG